MLKYRVYLSTTSEGTVATIPISTQYEINIKCGSLNNENLKNFLQIKIKNCLERLEGMRVKLEPPEDIGGRDDEHSLIVEIPVNYKLKRGYAERIMPVVGHISNMLAILSLSIVSYLAMKVTVGDKDDGSKAFSFIGGLYSLIITFCIYVFSGASRGLASVGRKLDSLRVQQPISNEYTNLIQPDNIAFSLETEVSIQPVTKYVANDKTSTVKIIKNLGVGTLVLGNAAINAVAIYQQVGSLGKAAVTPDEHLMSEIVKILPFILMSSAAISNTAFQWGFIQSALEYAMSCCIPKAKVIHSSSEAKSPEEIVVDPETTNSVRP